MRYVIEIVVDMPEEDALVVQDTKTMAGDDRPSDVSYAAQRMLDIMGLGAPEKVTVRPAKDGE